MGVQARQDPKSTFILIYAIRSNAPELKDIGAFGLPGLRDDSGSMYHLFCQFPSARSKLTTSVEDNFRSEQDLCLLIPRRK